MTTLLTTAAVLLVRDLDASVAYWRDTLGFTANVWGDPPNHAIVARDTCRLMLSLAPADHANKPNWEINGIWNAYFWVDDAKHLFEEFTASGARIDYRLGEKPYGVLEFGIQDIDGHDIAFGQDLSTP